MTTTTTPPVNRHAPRDRIPSILFNRRPRRRPLLCRVRYINNNNKIRPTKRMRYMTRVIRVRKHDVLRYLHNNITSTLFRDVRSPLRHSGVFVVIVITTTTRVHTSLTTLFCTLMDGKKKSTRKHVRGGNP